MRDQTRAENPIARRRRIGRRREVRRGARIGDFVILGRIATGGAGVVFAAEHAETRTPAAVKVLHPVLASSREAVTRFHREVHAITSIRHPNVIEVYQVGELPSGRPFFAMEHLKGVDLAAHIAESGALSPTEARAVLAPLCDALDTVHRHDIVHRDLKASNVFLEDWVPRRATPDTRQTPGRVILLDFGAAKLLKLDDGLSAERLIGTPSCMAPEQITCARVDARTDVYALGALVYHMLTGKHAFSGESMSTLQYMHVHGARPRPSSIVPSAGPFDELVMTAMAVEPFDRYRGPKELLDAFDTAMGSRTGAAAGERVAVVVEASGEDGEAIAALLAETHLALAELGFRRVLDTSTTLVRVTEGDGAGATRSSLRQIAARMGPAARIQVALTDASDDALVDAVADRAEWLALADV